MIAQTRLLIAFYKCGPWVYFWAQSWAESWDSKPVNLTQGNWDCGIRIGDRNVNSGQKDQDLGIRTWDIGLDTLVLLFGTRNLEFQTWTWTCAWEMAGWSLILASCNFTAHWRHLIRTSGTHAWPNLHPHQFLALLHTSWCTSLLFLSSRLTSFHC